MIRPTLIALLVAISPAAVVAASAQALPGQAISGTRLDVVATGEVTRVPDVATIGTGVTTLAPTAREAIRQNAAQMERVRAALKRAGIADRDIRTSNVNLNPEYRYVENQPPQLTGYRASNEVSVRFRDIARTGDILDALVGEGANQINGPALGIDKPEAALDEARTAALGQARARADLYARAMGKRVARILSVSESGASMPPYPVPMMVRTQSTDAAAMKIDPGEQSLSVTLSVSFELE